jgi:plasmid stabilization system protein ParE
VEVVHHRLVKHDLRAALAYYEAEGGRRLGDRFFEEVEKAIARVLRNPRGFHFVEQGLRRAPLKSFPYHILYEETDTTVHFLVLRHDQRHPSFGLARR